MSEDITSLYSPTQRKALSITPHVTGFLSFFGSAFIVLEILRDRKKKGQVYHRIMLGLATSNMLTSIFLGLSTWPIPRGTEYVYAARGNEATCRTQGFFVILSLLGPMYNTMLSTYYLMVIGYGKKERQCRIMERWSHVIVISVGLAFAIAGLGLNLYHSTTLWCSIGPIPCDGEDVNCNSRGNNFELYRWILFGIPVWICIFILTGQQGLVFYKVRNQELVSRKWRRGTESRAKSLTNQVAVQCFSYVSSFFMTWIFPTISRAMSAFGGMPPFALVYLVTLLLPLQGLINFFIYMRPRYARYRKNHPDESAISLMRQTFLKTCLFWRRRDDTDDDDMNLGLKVGELYQTTAVALSTVVGSIARHSVGPPEQAESNNVMTNIAEEEN